MGVLHVWSLRRALLDRNGHTQCKKRLQWSDAYSSLYRSLILCGGWLTAYNKFTPDTANIIPNGVDGAALWLNNYCTKNPLSNLHDALQALVTEAYPSRQR
jgi:hypothetical protein